MGSGAIVRMTPEDEEKLRRAFGIALDGSHLPVETGDYVGAVEPPVPAPERSDRELEECPHCHGPRFVHVDGEFCPS